MAQAWAGSDRRKTARTHLGNASGVALRQRVYRTREALEVDEIDGYDVARRRVFFDDVLLVTYHQFLGWAFLTATGVLALLFGAISAATAMSDRRAGLVMFLISALPFLLAFGLRLLLKMDAITVYGRRSKAQIHYFLRKGRAREVYAQIGRAVRQSQERLARELHVPRAVPVSAAGAVRPSE